VDCSNHPSFLPESIRQQVRESMSRLVEMLALCDGALHTQFIAEGERFWIIECMRRGPGDLYGSLITLSTGVDYIDLLVRPYLKESIPRGVTYETPKYFGRHTVSRAEPLVNFTFSCSVPARDLRIVALKSSGERLDAAPYDKLAILFAEYFSREDMRDYTPRLASFISIQTPEEYRP
jgi:hypothetical protein